MFNIIEPNTFVLSHVTYYVIFFYKFECCEYIHDFIHFGFSGVEIFALFHFFDKLHYSWSVQILSKKGR